jgi:hypothetical protein
MHRISWNDPTVAGMHRAPFFAGIECELATHQKPDLFAAMIVGRQHSVCLDLQHSKRNLVSRFARGSPDKLLAVVLNAVNGTLFLPAPA